MPPQKRKKTSRRAIPKPKQIASGKWPMSVEEQADILSKVKPGPPSAHLDEAEKRATPQQSGSARIFMPVGLPKAMTNPMPPTQIGAEISESGMSIGGIEFPGDSDGSSSGAGSGGAGGFGSESILEVLVEMRELIRQLPQEIKEALSSI